MGPFVAQRLLDAISVLLGVSFITFALLFLTGDPTYMLVPENYSREQIAEFRHRAGLDRPWYVQYGAFLRRAVTGDFGTSLRSQLPALPLVLERLPATVELACAAMALSLGVTVPVGILAATRRRSLIDTASLAEGVPGVTPRWARAARRPVTWAVTSALLSVPSPPASATIAGMPRSVAAAAR